MGERGLSEGERRTNMKREGDSQKVRGGEGE